MSVEKAKFWIDLVISEMVFEDRQYEEYFVNECNRNDKYIKLLNEALCELGEIHDGKE